MQATTATMPLSKTRRWLGRLLSALPVVFLLFDGAIKVANIPPVVDASVLLGWPVDLAPAIGVLLLACLAVYLAPPTAVLGAIVLTGYLGGAVALQVRIAAGPFSIVLPIILGALIWGGLFLRDDQLRTLLPLRRSYLCVYATAAE
jgi:hypothetical protein